MVLTVVIWMSDVVSEELHLRILRSESYRDISNELIPADRYSVDPDHPLYSRVRSPDLP
jgi:hypothetical protein